MSVSDRTLVPIGIAVLVIGSSAAWVTRQEIQTSAHAAKIEESDKKFERIDGKLTEVLERLAIIQGRIERIKR